MCLEAKRNKKEAVVKKERKLRWCVCVCVQREEMINDGGGLEREMFFSRVFWEAVQTQGDQVPADRVS